MAMRMGEVFVPITSGTLAYFGVAFLARVPFAHDVVTLFRKRFRL